MEQRLRRPEKIRRHPPDHGQDPGTFPLVFRQGHGHLQQDVAGEMDVLLPSPVYRPQQGRHVDFASEGPIFFRRHPFAVQQLPDKDFGSAFPEPVQAVQPGGVLQSLRHVVPQFIPQPLIFCVGEVHPLAREAAEGLHGVVPAHIDFSLRGFRLEGKGPAQGDPAAGYKSG